jgi:LDH2 family malate/lactate/ureidoglycolate dehydrogenase
MMMDIFGGLLSGAAFPGNVVDMNKSMSEPQNVGHWFLVFRPEVFLGSKEEYLKRMDEMIGRVRGCEKAADVERSVRVARSRRNSRSRGEKGFLTPKGRLRRCMLWPRKLRVKSDWSQCKI